MSREDKRAFYQRVRRLNYHDFWRVMDDLHIRAYQLAAKHYQEAMDIVAFRADRKPWLVAMPIDVFLRLIGRETGRVD